VSRWPCWRRPGCHGGHVNLVVVIANVGSGLGDGQQQEEVAQVQGPLVQLDALVLAAEFGEAEPVLRGARPEVCLAVEPSGTEVEGEGQRGGAAEQVLAGRLGGALCMAGANVPLSDA